MQTVTDMAGQNERMLKIDEFMRNTGMGRTEANEILKREHAAAVTFFRYTFGFVL